MLLQPPPRYYVNRVRSILVALVDAHNEKYHEPMWLVVSAVDDESLDVHLTIGGRTPVRLTENMRFKWIENGLKNKLREWIDETRASGTREQQRSSHGKLPPLEARPPKRRASKPRPKRPQPPPPLKLVP